MPDDLIKPIHKLLAANRSEIAIRVFRSTHELGIRTVAIYSHEDRFALHRFKADEAYEVGKPGEPIRAYLNIPEIVELALRHKVDAIHPGYGFLSENPAFARACREAGIVFIGPRTEVLEKLGDKVTARAIAQKAGVPILTGSAEPVAANEQAKLVAEKIGYPLIIKAAMGGGGRGMRVVESPEQLTPALEQAQREAKAAFGIADVFLERFIRRARHIEVQLLGDKHSGLVHLMERDCSIQRRHQKVVEIAPAVNLNNSTRQGILDSAVTIGRAVRLDNAGTVEFLVDVDTGEFYFIEVNPRIQVEHTVTEEITGYDLIRSQIFIAQGMPLSDPEIGMGDQSKISPHGAALQCRVTTEDPANGFMPDYGRLSHYRSASGVGIRLDAGTAFSGAVITPFYDSLLVKVTAHGLRFQDAARRMERCLQEFRVRGVKTNIPFLINLVSDPQFLAGGVTTSFLEERKELVEQLPKRQDRASKLLGYLGHIIVNGHPEVPANFRWPGSPPKARQAPASALQDPVAIKPGTRQKFLELGAEKFSAWVKEQKRLLVTDTTMRDAHQSLLATRMRTYDLLQIAPTYAVKHADLFSLEMWGGATFDASLRFLKECPWQRLAVMRERVPNILFQMLFRSANAVGYSNYPDNVVQAFVREAHSAGIDLFRVFDSLNWMPNLKVAIDAVRDAGALCETAICYTGDILDKNRPKFGEKYYVDLAKQMEKAGANLLCIKDMAGICKPFAAQRLVHVLKQEIGIPIHFHTHDCAAGQMAALLLAAQEGVDIVDCAFAPLAGLTSQPSLNALVEALRFTPRDTGIAPESLKETTDYWTDVRKFYLPFESGQAAPSAEIYEHEMPGGQYTNLAQQAQALGLGERWREVGRMYAEVNRMFGDIIKVTPSSKVVGDMALFMLANNLTPADVIEGPRELAFPESVVEFFEGKLGQPPGGFPEKLQKRILRGRTPLTQRMGELLPPVNLEDVRAELETKFQRNSDRDLLSYLMYPRVFADFVEHQRRYSDTSMLPTPTFFYGTEKGDEVSIEIDPGKTLIIKFQTIGDPHPDGKRLVFFELNGQPREVLVLDRKLVGQAGVAGRAKAEVGNPLHVAAPMPGSVVNVTVASGEKVEEGQKLLTMEAMKMETTIYAERSGTIAEVLVRTGMQVEGGDLLLRFEG
jgi:pyruvate carboxylase